MGESTSCDKIVPFVGILIPILNEAGYIEDCLRSVLQQKYPADRYEILVLDGGSTDGTQAIVQKIIAEHPQVRLVHNPGKTQVKAFNLGVKESKGEIIIRMDAHARYQNDYVQKCVDTLARTGAANVGGVCITEPSGDALIARTVALVYQMRFGIGGARFRVGGKEGPVDTVPFGAFPRDTFNRVGVMNDVLVRGEDNEFNSRIRSAGLMVYFDPAIVSTYYARPTLRGFFRQMYGNGLYHILTLMVNRSGCSVRHFIPFFFVMSLIGCLLLGFLWTPMWWAGIGVFAAYMGVDLLASLAGAKQYGWVYILTLPWTFLGVHCCYGFGTFWGIFKFAVPKLLGK